MAHAPHQNAGRVQRGPLDALCVGAMLMFWWPALVAIAVAVKLTSDGPVFERREHIGADGRPVTSIRFRTTVDGSSGQLTPVGRFLREYRLDELPCGRGLTPRR